MCARWSVVALAWRSSCIVQSPAKYQDDDDDDDDDYGDDDGDGDYDDVGDGDDDLSMII